MRPADLGGGKRAADLVRIESVRPDVARHHRHRSHVRGLLTTEGRPQVGPGSPQEPFTPRSQHRSSRGQMRRSRNRYRRHRCPPGLNVARFCLHRSSHPFRSPWSVRRRKSRSCYPMSRRPQERQPRSRNYRQQGQGRHCKRGSRLWSHRQQLLFPRAVPHPGSRRAGRSGVVGGIGGGAEDATRSGRQACPRGRRSLARISGERASGRRV